MAENKASYIQKLNITKKIISLVFSTNKKMLTKSSLIQLLIKNMKSLELTKPAINTFAKNNNLFEIILHALKDSSTKKKAFLLINNHIESASLIKGSLEQYLIKLEAMDETRRDLINSNK